MVDAHAQYWIECIEASFDEYGIQATKEQIEGVAGDAEVACENKGLAFGYTDIPTPLCNELEATKRALRAEQDKVVCPECKGNGYLTTYGPIHSGTSQCFKCRGAGKVSL